MPDLKAPVSFSSPVGFLVWTIGVLGWAIVARVGWELGGKLWAMF